MEKIIRTIRFLSIILTIVFLLSSCMTTKTQVGTYKEIQGASYKYSKGKQFWLFWGLVPIGKTNVNTPSDGNCEIITKFKAGDVLLSVLTGGLITSYTIKVKAKREKSTPVKINSSVTKDITFKNGDSVTFKSSGKLMEGKIVGINANGAIVEFINILKQTTKKEIAFDKLTKIEN